MASSFFGGRESLHAHGITRQQMLNFKKSALFDRHKMFISTCIATTSTQLSVVAKIHHLDKQTNEQTTVCARGSAH